MAFIELIHERRRPSMGTLVSRTKSFIREYVRQNPPPTEADARFVAALLGERPAEPPREPGSNVGGMKKDEAHRRLLALMLEDASSTIELTQADLAKRVGCSVNTLKRTDAWAVLEPFREQGSAADRRKLTLEAMEHLVSEGGGDDLLKHLTDAAARTRIRTKF